MSKLRRQYCVAKRRWECLQNTGGEECENMDQGVLCVLDEMSVEMAMERLIHG